MKNGILSVTIYIASICWMLTACMKDGDTMTLSNKASITSVTLGNVKRTLHTKDSKGNDSTYVSPYTASAYVFRIDQINNTIQNPEPLLYESDLSSVLVTITGNGTVFWRKHSTELNNDAEWAAYSSSDSIDVSVPLDLRVTSYDGTQVRDYVFSVNVYRSDPASLAWTHVGDCDILDRFVVMRALVDEDGLCVIGIDVNGVAGSVRPLDSNPSLEPYGSFDASRTGIDAIDELMDRTSDEYLPTRYVSGAKVTTSAGQTMYVLAGLRDESYGDKTAVVWSCREGAASLLHHNYNNEDGNTLPALSHLRIVAHDGRLLAVDASLRKVYISYDYGLTWDATTGWATPDELKGRDKPLCVAALDGQSDVYVISGDQVWTARSNAL